MSNKLKPCPFCGGAATVELQMHNSVRPDDYVVGCEEFNCRITTIAESATKQGAIDKWNIRATDQQNEALLAQVEELRERLERSCEEVMSFNTTIFAKHRWINATKKLITNASQQSLDSLKARIEEETIDRCANKIEEFYGMGAGSLALDLMPRNYQPSNDTKADKGEAK